MKEFKSLLERDILPNVTKPLRYQGNEYNVVKKEWDKVKLRALFAFPDTYEVGMSHLGLSILYHLVNQQSEYLMERVFAPWIDMEEELRKRDLPLFSLESTRPIGDFDCIGFTLQYEMSYTNILNMLNLGRVPLLAKDRKDEDPIIMAGGPCATNPEPLADFIDFFVIGEGEEIILEVLDVLAQNRRDTGGYKDRELLFRKLAQIDGVYVPSFFKPVYNAQKKLAKIDSFDENVPSVIKKRLVKDLNKSYFPEKPIVPYLEVVHDRIMLEVLRGCNRGCRFCQAGMIYRPVRERNKDILIEQAKTIAKNTGHNEISLTSLSTADHSCIKPVLKEMLDEFQTEKIGVSLPSLRVDAFSVDLAKEIQRVRKTGLTFAPEAGSQRLRDVINKGVTEDDMLEVAEEVFSAGWYQIKLYFMIGLPTETFQDLDGIVDLAYKVLQKGLSIKKEKGYGKQPKITISVSSFVPKAHTPFQWEGQDEINVLKRKQQYLKEKIKDRRITYNYHEAELSFMEAVFAKGDRRLNQVLLKAWKDGCKFDGWSEHFDFAKWMNAFEEYGIEPARIANNPINYEDVLPWSHIDMGIRKEFLWQERTKAYNESLTSDCRYDKCSVCGVCMDMGVKLVLEKGESHDN